MPLPYAVEATTARLRLRMLTMDDAPAFQQVTNHEAVTRAIHFLPSPFTPDDARSLLVSCKPGQDGFVGVWLKGSKQLVGVLGLHDHGQHRIEIGYWVHPAWHRQGIAREAATGLIAFLRDAMPDGGIVAECRPENGPSWALLHKLGFIPTGQPGKRPGRQLLLWQGGMMSGPSFPFMTDRQAMEQALALAAEAAEAGEVPVGAVVLDEHGYVLAMARNHVEEHHDASAHAELLAMRQAARRNGRTRLGDCTLVVTLEPCPMCAAAMTHFRINRLIYGAYDPKGGAVDHGPRLFHRKACLHRPDEIISGMREGEAAAQLRAFFQRLRG